MASMALAMEGMEVELLVSLEPSQLAAHPQAKVATTSQEPQEVVEQQPLLQLAMLVALL